MLDKGYLVLNDNQRLEVASLLTTLKEAGIVREETELANFITGCYFRGLWEYQKDLVRNDCWKNKDAELYQTLTNMQFYLPWLAVLLPVTFYIAEKY